MRRLCMTSLLLAAVAGYAQSNPPPAAATLEQLKTAADEYARAGDAARQAETYERLAVLDPSARQVLAPVLVRLYAGLGDSDKALAWAGEAMRRNPDPQAYLAGVHALLGDYAQAQGILDKELEAAADPRRKVALYWQLADIALRQSNAPAARAALTAAADLARGTPDEAATQRRLADYAGENE